MSGLDRFRYSPIAPVSFPDENLKLTLSANDRGEVWAGSSSPSSFVYLQDGKVKNMLLSPQTIQTSSVYRDKDGGVWWGGRGGIWYQQGQSFKLYAKPKDLEVDYIWEIFRADDSGGLWINYGDQGLIYFKDGVWERRQTPAGLPDRGPSASFEDEQSRIWLGYTENRVYVLDGANAHGYTSADGIEVGRIKVIRGRGENLWIGGETGLAFFKDGRFHTVKTEGKQIGTVSGMIATGKGDLWLNEVRGIVRIPADELRRLKENPEHAVKYRLYDFLDNMPGNPQMNFTVSTAIETIDRRLWFATDKGLAMIDPERLEQNAVVPPVVIKSMVADKKLYPVTDGVSLPAGTADLQINYTALSLSIPERVNFKYRLEGNEDHWHDAGTRREAFYTNLAPGKYRFRVIAANNDGVWNEQGAGLEFEILPAFYQTGWFSLAVLAALGALVWISYQWRVRQVKSRLHLLYEERLQERTRIAQDLHDTLLQGVFSATMQLDAAAGQLTDNSPVKSKMNDVSALMARVMDEGRNTIRGLHSPGSHNTQELENSFADLKRDFDARGEVDFQVKVKGKTRTIHPVVRDNIYRLGREAMANAFSHSKADAIEIEIDYGAKNFGFWVRDNGCGIDQKMVDQGREGHLGLSGMRDCARRIGGKLKIWSRDNGGTEVELIVPDRIAYQKDSEHNNLWRLKQIFSRKINSRNEAKER